MEGMNSMDYVVLGTKILMQIALIVVPVLLAFYKNREFKDGELVRVISDIVAVIAREIVTGKIASSEAKEEAMRRAALSIGKTKLNNRSLRIAEGALEGEVHRLKAGSLAPKEG